MRNGAATEAKLYEIKVRGHVRAHRLRAFDKLNITHEAGGETTIAVRIADQAALYGLLVRIRDLGVPLLSVRCVECAQDRADEPAYRADGPAHRVDEPAQDRADGTCASSRWACASGRSRELEDDNEEKGVER